MQARGYSYRIASVPSLSGFLFGFDIAIINGAIVFLRRQFRWTEIETHISAGSLLAGCAAGAAVAGALSDCSCAKVVLLLSAVIFGLSSAATALPNSPNTSVAARLVAG